MDNKEDSKILNISKYAIMCLVCFLLGAMGMYLYYNTGTRTIKSNPGKYDILDEITGILDKEYYKDIDKDELIEGAASGLVASIGDKHTQYLTKDEAKSFMDSLSDSYYGIGAIIFRISEEGITIKKVFEDSPAQKAGLQKGDIIISIDGKSTKDMTVEKAASTLKSSKSQIATVVVKRNGEEKTFEITKSTVPLKSVSGEMLDNNIGYVVIDTFGEGTYQEFVSTLNNLENQGMKSLIIDLRDNGGGYLSTVLYMASEFLDSNTIVLQTKVDEKTEAKKYMSINNNTKNYKVVVLVNEQTASASEIMTAALKEQYGATVVGTTTYGKGTVQLTKELSNGGMLKYTTEEWLTSKGESINDKGITPDVEVELTEDYLKDPLDKNNDAQLQKAIEVIK
ncbi:MAG: S41 family peptidase [Bacilli bacterium]|nr:S41 family peptidase [Bacilli bacterium]